MSQNLPLRASEAESVRSHLSLIRGEGGLSFAPDLCDELCAVVDEALSLEDALRAVLRVICTRTRWMAGRATHRDALPVWYVATYESIPLLRRLIAGPPRTTQWNEPWTAARQPGVTILTFPLEWCSDSKLELYSATAVEGDLDDLARALVPVGALLRRKQGSRAQRAADRTLFLSSPMPSFVVAAADRAILQANHAAAALLGYSVEELRALKFDDLCAAGQPVLPSAGFMGGLRGRDGSERIVEVRTEPYAAEGGAPALIVIAHDVTDRIQLEKRLETAAATDALTGLPNRAAFERQLSAAVERARAGALFAVLFIDLDRFKFVNDTLGHAAGDALLCEVARRLGSQLRNGDVAARLGGDEFTVLLPLRDLGEAVTVAERVLRALLEPLELGATVVSPSASIGVAFAASRTASVATVMQEADAAMYRAKAKGPGNVVFSPKAP